MSSAPKTSRAQDPSVFSARPWLAPALICGGVALAYAGTLGFEFVYDDKWVILENPWLTSWSYVPRYFTSHVWAFAHFHGNFWRPLFLLWFLLQRTIVGLHPAGWHAATVLLHAGVTAMVYALARRLTNDRGAAALAALIFGLHPALIESVAWACGSTDPLLAAFFVPGFLSFLNWRQTHSRAWLAAALGLYALALMAKEPAVMLPVLIFVYAWIYAESSGRQRLRAAVSAILPYVPVTLIYAVVHWSVLEHRPGAPSAITPLHIVMTAPSLLAFYLRLLLVPFDVSPEYGLELVRAFSLGRVLLPALLLLAAAALLYLWARRDHQLQRLVPLASAWVVLPLLPAIYAVRVAPHDFAHARYLYLPCVGFAIMLGAAIRRLRIGRTELFGAPALQVVAGGVIVALLAVGCLTQQIYWANNLLLFSRGLKTAPNNPTAMTSVAIELGLRQKYPEAVELFQRALLVEPDNRYASFGLGYTYLLQGRYAEAEPLMARAVALDPYASDADQFAYLGLVENKLGNLPKAEWAVRQAVQRRPQVERYRYALALLLEQQGKLADAAREFQAVLALNPANADARARLARAQSAVR